MFAIDEFRRIFCEVIMPYFMQNKDDISRELKKKLTDKTNTLKKQLSGKSKTSDEKSDTVSINTVKTDNHADDSLEKLNQIQE